MDERDFTRFEFKIIIASDLKWPSTASRGLVHLRGFTSNSDEMEKQYCNPSFDIHITASRCTCHDITAAVSYAKLCSDYFLRIQIN